jgi:hypothetical protein
MNVQSYLWDSGSAWRVLWTVSPSMVSRVLCAGDTWWAGLRIIARQVLSFCSAFGDSRPILCLPYLLTHGNSVVVAQSLSIYQHPLTSHFLQEVSTGHMATQFTSQLLLQLGGVPWVSLHQQGMRGSGICPSKESCLPFPFSTPAWNQDGWVESLSASQMGISSSALQSNTGAINKN